MNIELLHHHVSSSHSTEEFGVFDGWLEAGLEPTMKAVQQRVIPRLKKEVFENGEYVYPFLTKNPTQRHEFTKR